MTHNYHPDCWIGVDFDRTLAEYEGGSFSFLEFGKPLQPMVERIKGWVDEGIKVKIFTARASGFDPKVLEDMEMLNAVTVGIQDWLEAVGLPRLEITCTKDYRCIQIWDDIAVSMDPNTGNPSIKIV